MSLLESYVQALSRDLKVGGEERERILAELRQHLEEARLEFIAAGHAEPEAERLVIARFGEPRDICRNFSSVYGTSPIRFILNLFHQEKTLMRLTLLRTLDWCLIVAVGAIAGIHALGCAIFVMPKIEALRQELRFEPHPLHTTFISLSDAVRGWWWVALILLITGLVIAHRRMPRDLFAPLAKTTASAISAAMALWLVLGLWASVAGFQAASMEFLRPSRSGDRQPSPAAPAAPAGAAPAAPVP